MLGILDLGVVLLIEDYCEMIRLFRLGQVIELWTLLIVGWRLFGLLLLLQMLLMFES